MNRIKQLKKLQKILKYRFRRTALLNAAMTAPSWRGHSPELSVTDNQRLEFLGDAVFGLLAAAYVFEDNPDLDEGELTLRVMHLANGRTLAALARSLTLDEFLLYSSSDDSGTCSDRELEDAIEAVFGAVWCDGGYKAAAALFRRSLSAMPALPTERWHGNPKGALQELAQRHAWIDSPRYTLVGTTGPDHNPRYTMRVEVQGGFQADFTAGSKRAAEIGAAETLIRALKNAGFEMKT
jgi:ribonuclease III